MTNELKVTISAIEHAEDKRRKAPQANFRFYEDRVLPENSVIMEVNDKMKVIFLVSGHGEPLLVYLGEKQHTLNLRTGKFVMLNGKAYSEA